MNLRQRIELAFGNRSRPSRLVETKDLITSEQRDALWFEGRSWGDVTWDQWEAHRDAFFAFTPEAFVYYLPSILCLSIDFPGQWFAPVDSLLKILDRSPVVEHWDAFVVTRLVGLKTAEYETLKDWLLWLSDQPMPGSEEDLGRALDTIDLLQAETARVRLMIGTTQNS